jgi:hypothetical protein
MRFLLSVIDSASRTGSTDEMAAIDIFNEKLQNNGHWIFACGVDSPLTAKLVDNRAGAAITRDLRPAIVRLRFVHYFEVVLIHDNGVSS